MSHDEALLLQDRLEIVLNQFEQEVTNIETIMVREELKPILEAAENLRTVLTEVKGYFIEVRNQLSTTSGIPPAKELAQLVIGASTEALSAVRETLHHLEEVKERLKSRRKTPLTREEIHYADFSSKVAIRKSRHIINRISEEAEKLPEHL